MENITDKFLLELKPFRDDKEKKNRWKILKKISTKPNRIDLMEYAIGPTKSYQKQLQMNEKKKVKNILNKRRDSIDESKYELKHKQKNPSLKKTLSTESLKKLLIELQSNYKNQTKK